MEETLAEIDYDITCLGGMKMATAINTSKALVAALLSGCYCPPPRMSVLKTILHPSFNGRVGCVDPDCLRTGDGQPCLGNHLELETLPMPPDDQLELHDWKHHEYLTTDVLNVIVHHKNDRR